MAVKGVATFFVILAVLACVDAHTIFSSISVGGVAQPDGDCMRPQASANKDSPIATVTSPDMTCGFLPNAANPANRKCPVAAGSKVGLQWWHYTPGDDIIADSHKGPCIVYLAKSDTGAGNVWFKIYEDGYNENTKQWCVDKLIANRGYFEVTIPGDISPGNYLLRGEVIALHGAHEKGGSQPYVHCAELTISGTGTANPAGVALPGAYTENDPGIFINIYYPAVKNYIIPGPAVYQPSSTPTSAPTPAPSGGVTNAPTPAPTSAPTATRAPAPSGNIVAYDDAIKAPFEDWSWAKDITVSATSVKQAGSASLRFKPQSYQAAYFYCAGCIDTTKHSAIEFWINGGNAGGQSVNFNLLKGTEKSGADLSVNKYTGATSIQANTWVKGTVQLSGFTAGVYDGFWFQDSSGTTTQGDVYVDSITVLAKANTGSPTPAPTNPDGTTPTPVVPSSSTTDGTNKLIDNSAVVATPTIMLVLVALLALLL